MANKKMPQYKRIWIYVGIVVVIILVASTIIANFFSRTPSHYELGQSAYLEGAYDTALLEFSSAISENSNNPDYFIGRGLTHLNLQNFDSALVDFDTAIALNPESTDTRPYQHGGYIMLRGGNYEVAVEVLTIAIERGNTSALIYSYRGLAFYNLGDYASTVVDLEIATTIDATLVDSFRILGDAHYALGNNSLALTAYTRYMEIATEPESYVIENINAINEQE